MLQWICGYCSVPFSFFFLKLFVCFVLAGSLVVERCPGRPPVTNHHTGPRAEAPSGGLSMSAQQQRQSTLAQLQMQVAGSSFGIPVKHLTYLNTITSSSSNYCYYFVCLLFCRVSFTTNKIQFCHVFCPRSTNSPISLTGSPLLTTGPGIRVSGYQDLQAHHPQPNPSMRGLHPLKASQVWHSRGAGTPIPTPEAPHHPCFKI